MSIVTLHDKYGVILAVLAAVGAAVGILALFRPALLPMVRSYSWLVVAAVALQVVLGLVLIATGHRPSQLLHWIYGAATLLALPLAVLIGKSFPEREPIWVMGGAVATLLFAFRAVTTG